MKEINLEEILKKHHVNINVLINVVLRDDIGETEGNRILNAMKDACKQVLELAAENAKCEEIVILDKYQGFVVNKQSIINTINQVK